MKTKFNPTDHVRLEDQEEDNDEPQEIPTPTRAKEKAGGQTWESIVCYIIPLGLVMFTWVCFTNYISENFRNAPLLPHHTGNCRFRNAVINPIIYRCRIIIKL